MNELKHNRLTQEVIEANRSKKKHWKSTYIKIKRETQVVPVC